MNRHPEDWPEGRLRPYCHDLLCLLCMKIDRIRHRLSGISASLQGLLLSKIQAGLQSAYLLLQRRPLPVPPVTQAPSPKAFSGGDTHHQGSVMALSCTIGRTSFLVRCCYREDTSPSFYTQYATLPLKDVI